VNYPARKRNVDPIVWAPIIMLVGLIALLFGVTRFVNGWTATHGGPGIRGVFTLDSCPKECHGTFVSSDGSVVIHDIHLSGEVPEAAPAGTRVPAAVVSADSYDAYQINGPWWMWAPYLLPTGGGVFFLIAGTTNLMRRLARPRQSGPASWQ
jgi:hypothetical protein